MALRIFKYYIGAAAQIRLPMSKGAKVLKVGEQDEKLYLWALVEDVPYQTVAHRFVVRGTGHAMDGTEGDYIDSVIMTNGLVWHVFHKREL